jgi:hypothetical protein
MMASGAIIALVVGMPWSTRSWPMLSCISGNWVPPDPNQPLSPNQLRAILRADGWLRTGLTGSVIYS